MLLHLILAQVAMQQLVPWHAVALAPPSLGLLWLAKVLVLWLAADSTVGGVLAVRRELGAWSATKLEHLLLLGSWVFYLATFLVLVELRSELAWAIGLWVRACRGLGARLVLWQVYFVAASWTIAEADTCVTCQPMALVAEAEGLWRALSLSSVTPCQENGTKCGLGRKSEIAIWCAAPPPRTARLGCGAWSNLSTSTR